MRIHARKNSRRSDRLTLNLASMIDCTFLLLAYFIVTTIVVRPEDRLSPNLQSERDETAGEQSDFQPQIVEVLVLEGATRFRIGGRVFDERDALTETLRELPKDAGLFVKVHPGPVVAAAAAAMQAGRDAGFESVTYIPVRTDD